MLASAWMYGQDLGKLKTARRIDSPPQLRGARLLVLWGGEDISPSIYKQEKVLAQAGNHPSPRDKCEINLARAAIQEGIPILGICRGAQLLCALGGGSLYQHVDNHGYGEHKLVYQGEEMTTNSCHHQMMIPTDEMVVIGYSPCLSPEKYLDQKVPVVHTDVEPEIVHFPKMNALGIQGHPEWLIESHKLHKLTKYLTGVLLNVEI